MKEGIIAGGGVEDNDPKLAPFVDRVKVLRDELRRRSGLRQAEEATGGVGRQFNTKGNRPLLSRDGAGVLLGHHQLSRRAQDGAAGAGKDGTTPWVRTIIEKPFGHDLDSARELNDEVNKVFNEDQIFRIDHYLGRRRCRISSSSALPTASRERLEPQLYRPRRDHRCRVDRHRGTRDRSTNRPVRCVTWCRTM